VRVWNPFGTIEANSLLFNVSNRLPGVPPLPTLPPNPSTPVIDEIFQGGPYRQSQVALRFLLSDRDMKRTSVLVEYDDGSGFQTATPSPMSDSMVGLPAPDINMDHRFIWNAGADMGVMPDEENVTIRMTPWVGPVQGTPVMQTIRLKVEPRPTWPAKETVNSMTSLRLTIEEGDNQVGAGGFLLPEVLKVKVEGPNDQGQIVFKDGIKVSFRVVAPQGFDFELEEDDRYGTTSAADGMVAIRVRTPEVSTTQNFQVVASVVGVPNVTATFNLSVGNAEIDANAGNPSSLELGLAQAFSFFIDADRNNTTVEHIEPEKDDPLIFRVQAVNAVIDNPFPKVPELDYLQYSSAGGVLAGIRVTPLTSGTDVRLTVDIPNRPSIAAKTVTLPVLQPSNARRRIALGTSTSPYEDVFLKFEILDGYEANNRPQRAYPGITLARPFKVRITDQNGAEYRFQSINRARTDCNNAPAQEKLKIEWSGAAIGFSSASTGTPVGSLITDHDQPVYVTPDGIGPWRVDVRCFPHFDRLLDARPNTWSGTSSSGQPWCYKAWALIGQTTTISRIFIRGTFLIERAKLELTDVNTHLPVQKLKPGMRVRLRVHDLSPFIANSNPEPIALKLEQKDGRQPHVQQGQHGRWEENYDLFQFTLSQFLTEVIRIVQGSSAIPPGSSDKLHAIIPCASLVARSNSFNLSVPTVGIKRQRILIGNSMAMQEPPTGSRSYAGAQDTVLPHSGEFVRQWFDLQFASRHTTLRVGRTYRSQVASLAPEEEPLGPGWYLDTHAFLTVGRFLKWWHSGRSDDLYLYHHLGPVRPKGLFFDFSINSVIDQNTSAYEIHFKEGGKLHFNSDGSLRFIENNLRERIEYQYNEQGRLFRITDPMDSANRWLEFTYWTDEATPEWLGRLINVKDFSGRQVTYDYYGIAQTGGGPGWLKSVTLPPCPTMRGGDQPEMLFQRKETYLYEADAQMGWRLKKILNGDGGEKLVNHYRDGRITKQDPKRNAADTRAVHFDYTTPNQTIVTDPKGKKTKFVFPQSPYWDAALAREVVLDFGGKNIATKSEYNHDGLLLQVENPGGDKYAYVYDRSNPRQRARSNILVIIHTPRPFTSTLPPRERDRITTMKYEFAFNQVTELVTPEGNHPSSEPELFKRVFIFDNFGNILESRSSRLLNAYRKADGGIRWIEETPTKIRTYSPVFKRLIKEQDGMGVVTRFLYYPAHDPGGQGGSAPVEDGGGFLSKIIIDVEDNADRKLRFGDNVPLQTKSSQSFYNPIGDVTSAILHQGTALEKVNQYHVNVLHEVNRITSAAGTPLQISMNEFYDADGNLALRELEQPQASNIAGGSKLIKKWRYDWQHNPTEQSTRVWEMANSQFKWITKTAVYHADDQLHYVEPTYAREFPQVKQKHEWSGDGILQSVESGDQKINFEHTSSGELKEATSPDGAKTTYHHDLFNSTKAVVDERGSILETEKDETGRVVRKVIQHGHTTNGSRNYPATQSPYVALEETKFDENGNPRRSYAALTLFPSSTFAPPAAGTPVSPVTDFIGHDLPLPPSILSYQDEGKVMEGSGRSMKDTLYNAWQLPTRQVNDEGGYVWQRHSPHREIIEIQTFTGNMYEQEFDLAGNKVMVKEKTVYREAGNTITHEYAQKMDYDLHGRVIRVVDKKGNANRAQFDETGFACKVWDALGPDSMESFNGNPVNDPGNLTEIERDAMGNVVKLTRHLTDNGMGNGAPENNAYNPQAKTIKTYEFNPEGGPFIAFTDQAGYRTEIAYQPDGQVSHVHRWIAPGTGGNRHSTAKVYIQGTSLLDFIEDANGSSIKFHYGQHFMVGMEAFHPPNPTANVRVDGATFYAMGYDGTGQLEKIEDTNTGYTIEFERDSKGRLTREHQGVYRIEHTYRGDREHTLRYAASSFRIIYIHDRQGRLESMHKDGQQIARFHFNGDGRLRLREHGSLAISFISDEAGQPEHMVVQVQSLTIEFHLERDRLHRIKRLTRSYGGLSEETVWTYDSVGRIIKATYTAGWLPAPLETLRYYDGDDVLRKEERDTWQGSRVVIEQDRGYMGQITKRNNVAQLHDNNGNLTDDGNRQYIYDPWNRLIRMENNGQVLVLYEYDGQNRLHRKTAGTEVEEYVYNHWQLIEIHEANGGPTKERFIYSDQTDDLIAFEKNNQRYRAVIGPTGNVDSIFSENDQLVESYVYGLNGDFLVLDAQRQIKAAIPICRMLFQAKMYDADTKCYYFRTRWYDSTTGVFLSPEPMGFTQGPNHYSLATGDPVNKTDNFGTEEEESVIGAWFSGFAEGLGIGATALVNEGVKTLSFGQVEKDLIEVDPEDRRIYNYAKIPARIGTEAAFAAATMGIGTAAKGLQAGTVALQRAPQAIKYLAMAVEGSDKVAKAVRGVHALVQAGETAQAVTDIYKGYQMVKKGSNMGWVVMVAGGMGMPAGANVLGAIAKGAAVTARGVMKLTLGALRESSSGLRYVYRLVDANGRTLYYGISGFPWSRNIQHGFSKSGIHGMEVLTEGMPLSQASQLESMLIRKHVADFGTLAHSAPQYQQLAMATLLNKNFGLRETRWQWMEEDLWDAVIPPGQRGDLLPNPWG